MQKQSIAKWILFAAPLLFGLGACSVHVDNDRPHAAYFHDGRYYRDDHARGHYDVVIHDKGRHERVFVRDID